MNIKPITRCVSGLIPFMCGFALGYAYYYYILKKIPLPDYIGTAVSLALSLILGIGNVISIQIRCITLLVIPMYCGKPGRGVQKALVLTQIVAGPITNMGLNAREVVRVFACTTQLSYNLSLEKYNLMMSPLRRTALDLTKEIQNVKDDFGSIEDVIESIELEIEDLNELKRIVDENYVVAQLFLATYQSKLAETRLMARNYIIYMAKLHYRCENQLYRAVAVCIDRFTSSHKKCCDIVPSHINYLICWPLRVSAMCDLMQALWRNGTDICEMSYQVPPGLVKLYQLIKKTKREFCKIPENIGLRFRISNQKQPENLHDAKETAKRVVEAFEEKTILFGYVRIAMDVFIALVFLRIFTAAVHYHEDYLTSIDYDNVYVTRNFKALDERRKGKDKYTVLPLKKMERIRYINIQSSSSQYSQRKLITQILKVLLEVVTATTFVMLDRLFYEALDVVHQHAETDTVQQATRDLELNVEGTGIIASMIRKLLLNLTNREWIPQVSNSLCLPRPRLMPYVFFIKIYGGYLWILLLLFINPYTLRLRSCICSYFYPGREKQRILHLYNDILKKRLKMGKTLRRKAVQSVRAHYLAGETLLSLRMKFPHLLGWLEILPPARMTCLICGETAPRSWSQTTSWYTCSKAKCPFVYCAECWKAAGNRCLACDPSLVELSDIDSMSEEDLFKY